MRAATYVGDQTFRIEDRDAQAPGAGEVRLDVAYVGICGTDLHIKHGAMDRARRTPAVIGHEMSGTDRAPSATASTGWAPGDRVTVMPLDWCGACPACRAGHQHVCQNLVFVGIDSPGAMQQSWTVPARLLVRLPHGPRARARRARRARGGRRPRRPPRGRRAGRARRSWSAAGRSALLIAVVARGTRAPRCWSPSRTRTAARWRADWASRPSIPRADDVAAVVETWTAGAGADVAFEVSGTRPGLAAAIHALARPRAAGRRRDPRAAGARRPVPHLLARAGAVRRAGLRAGRLRARGRAAGDRRDPRRDAHLLGRAARAHAGRLRDLGGRRRRDEGPDRLSSRAAARRPDPRRAPSPFSLADRLAVVTGARRGIGLAIAEALARSGADVVGVSATIEADAGSARERVEAHGRRFWAMAADLGDRDAVRGLIVPARRARPSGRHPRQQRRDHLPRARRRAPG